MAAAGLARRSSAYVSGPPECPGDTQEEFGGNRLNQVAAQVLVPIDRAVQGERDRPAREALAVDGRRFIYAERCPRRLTEQSKLTA